MRRSLFFALALPLVVSMDMDMDRAAHAGPPPAALRVPGPLSPRNASYRLRARLDEVSHRLTGEGTLIWRNLEKRPADKLVFHLYQNAFKNRASTFIFEGGTLLRRDFTLEHGFGYIDVNALKLGVPEGSLDLLGRASLDETLLTVPLDVAVAPGQSVEVQFSWTVQLPEAIARSGYTGGFHAVTQWFPKLGVFDCADAAAPCRWRAHQYHGVTEFFADYGVYDVELEVADATVVGATGVLVDERPARERGRRLLSYHAEDVHDFAFFADPNFVEVNDQVADMLGSVAVRLLTRREHVPYSDRHLAAVRAALLTAERRLGAYPYSNVTVVIPPADGRGTAGMEYPTLFASLALPLPAGVHEMEAITAHEFLHQYFFGILGSDEVEEAWLDEGLNEAFTGWVMDDLFGPRCSVLDVLGLCLSAADQAWLTYRTTTRHLPIASRAFTIPQWLYGPLTYNHTAVVLRTLERYLGEERMAAGMRRYAERFRFRHPGQADFVAAMSEGASEDLGWFFRQALDSTRVADYQVLQLSSRPHRLATGLWDCPPPPVPNQSTDLSDPVDPQLRRARQELIRESQQAVCASAAGKSGRYELASDRIRSSPSRYDSELIIQRRGDFLFPVDVLATFADGSSERAVWSLAEQQAAPEVRVKSLHYLGTRSPLVRADVDPEQKLLLDENRLNNSRATRPQERPIARLWLTLVGALHTLFDLVGA